MKRLHELLSKMGLHRPSFRRGSRLAGRQIVTPRYLALVGERGPELVSIAAAGAIVGAGSIGPRNNCLFCRLLRRVRRFCR